MKEFDNVIASQVTWSPHPPLAKVPGPFVSRARWNIRYFLVFLKNYHLQNTVYTVARRVCTLHLNEKFLSTKTPWDFDANLEISDSI